MSFQEHFLLLLKTMDLDAILPVLLQQSVISMSEYEDLTRGQGTLKDRKDRLLTNLPRKGRNYFASFCRCLVLSGQGHLAKQMGFDVSSVSSGSVISTPSDYTSSVVSTPSSISGPVVHPPMPPSPAQYPPHVQHVPSLNSSSVQKVLILYSNDQLLNNQHINPLYRRTGEEYCKEVYNLVHTLTLFSRAPTADGVAFKCVYDVYEVEQQHISNFIEWTDRQLLQCQVILLLCSPSITNVARDRTVHMEVGLFSWDSLYNSLSHKHVIPVYLNMPKNHSWTFQQLHSTPQYELHTRVLEERLNDVHDELEFERKARELFETETRLKDFVQLLRILRKEVVTPPEPLDPIPLPPETTIPMWILQDIATKVQLVWQRLAAKLEVSFQETQRLIAQHPNNFTEAALEMLLVWQKEKGREGTLAVLIEALRSLRLNKLADEIEKLADDIEKY